MKRAAEPVLSDPQNIQMLSRWITLPREETPETVAFLSGAALATLDVVLRDPNGTLPGALLRDRLALDAAVACLNLEGRNETTLDIRDAVCLARPERLGRAGDALGPAGEMFVAWRRLARVNLATGGWKDRIRKVLPAAVAEAMSEFGVPAGTPVAQASQILSHMLRQFPREEAAALMLADLTLARAVGWDRPVPLLATHMARRDIRAIADGEDDVLPRVNRAILAACDGVIRKAADLDRRAAKLRMIAPKLRAKGSDEALSLFLSHDAVSPSGMLSPMIKGTSFAMTDRAARRLCDRLVELGVVRELTGRATFRLYGV
ncbi:hypothetical protein C1J03_23315 (plasmid) [Sulfitobacter sp. SK012]|uniref:DUF1403 family protein n=1 Tax=Sulfitobacter sp. SK012 TaxID=1389005 RepID=UPI000E0C63A5|nr:DUF1403 family protein [Sulfitobacter sp. SK012]AXI49064.1 hypothetical protein C1J03_23315 [Sulfitobacter sp. SK012]